MKPFDIDVYLYWNKSFMVSEHSTFDRIDLMQNECSQVLNSLEIACDNVITVKENIDGFTDFHWSKMLGVIDVVVCIDGVEIIRTGTQRPNSIKFMPNMLQDISIALLRSIDNLRNNNKQDDNTIMRLNRGGKGKFDQDKAFGDSVFKN